MSSFISKVAAAAVFLGIGIGSVQAADVSEIRIDWATYHPVSLLLRKEGILEKEFEKDGITPLGAVGSNKALEFFNTGWIGFRSNISI